MNKSTLPLSGSLVDSLLKSFCRKPYKGDDSWEDCSVGVATDSVVATDSNSAILIGRDAESHEATQRKEVVIECTRAREYGDPVNLDDIPRLIDHETGEVKRMPDARGAIRKRLQGMRSIAVVDPAALVAIGQVASKAGAMSVELFQPQSEDEGEHTAVGFRFSFWPDEELINLFSVWDGPVEARGVFKATKGGRRHVEDETEITEAIPAQNEIAKAIAEALTPEPVAVAKPEPEPEPEPVPEPVDADAELERGGYTLPKLSLLSQAAAEDSDSGDYGPQILDQLRAFNLPSRLAGVVVGPRVSLYKLEVPKGVKAAKYQGLADDLRMRLAVESVRIEPLQGEGVLGVEIPNRRSRDVGLFGLCCRHEFVDAESPLTVALGEDIAGRPVYADLAKMPHLLVAGATNSGKSIGLSSIIASLLLRNTPAEVRFVMIDPKRVELTLFDGIPHQMCPVVKDTSEAPGVLRAVWREMDHRYALLQDQGVRNIDGYNKKAPVAERMPYIVVVIDELADLMMAAGQEVETVIVRLAQMARAVGIHLVLATQRPSVDVVTGLIKANVPSRIAFAVASLVDSRVILDAGGAESLLGRGDMLFSPIGSSRPQRVQGAYVSEEDLSRICGCWRKQAPAPSAAVLVADDGDYITESVRLSKEERNK